MSRQLDYYYRHKAEINAKRKTNVKQSKTENVKQNSVKQPSNPRIPSPQAPSPSNKLMLRLHRLQRNYPIINAVSQARLKASGLKELRLNNNNQFLGSGFRITANILELEGIEVWSYRTVNLALLEASGYAMADATAQSVARQYGLSIDMKQASSPEGLKEIELTEHDLAEAEKQKGIIPLHYDSITHKPDVWMDKSFGLGGLESNKVPYLQRLTNLTNDIVDNNAWEVLKEQTLINSRQIGQLAEQLNIHAPYLIAWKEVADAIRNPSKRKLASQAIQRLGQRKLEV